MIRKFLAPDLGFGFEWQPESRRLYIIHANGVQHEEIANAVPTPEAAELLVGMWLKGYRSRKREVSRNPNVKHYHMLADTVKLTSKPGSIG